MSQPQVVIIGAGPAGLINARTLLNDGFHVTLIDKQDGIGGEWRYTYPDLTSNSPWGSFTFTGLDMPMPSDTKGEVIPASTYFSYLEDFTSMFLDSVQFRQVDLFSTTLVEMVPQDQGWILSLENPDGTRSKEHFDRVVIAIGPLGKPSIPSVLQSARDICHTSSLTPSIVSLLTPNDGKVLPLDSIAEEPADEDTPKIEGDEETVLVVGGGKSGMDAAALLAARGAKVVLSLRSSWWFAPAVPPGLMGAGRLAIVMGPSKAMDSWAEWFFHRTWLGASLHRKIWGMLKSIWSTLYTDLPKPTIDPYLKLPIFKGGLPRGPYSFLTLLSLHRITLFPHATPTSSSPGSVTFSTPTGSQTVKCRAVVAATGYASGLDFLDPAVKEDLGVAPAEPREGWREKVKKVRRKWVTLKTDEEEVGYKMPLVWRGLVPKGRVEQRDLVMAGTTSAFFAPSSVIEAESHWISSFFLNDPYLKLPKDIASACHEENEFLRARYPNVDIYKVFPSSMFYSGFLAIPHMRDLLRDLSLDPWRQKGPWWAPWKWIDVRADAEQYGTIGAERQARRTS